MERHRCFLLLCDGRVESLLMLLLSGLLREPLRRLCVELGLMRLRGRLHELSRVRLLQLVLELLQRVQWWRWWRRLCCRHRL